MNANKREWTQGKSARGRLARRAACRRSARLRAGQAAGAVWSEATELKIRAFSRNSRLKPFSWISAHLR